MNVLNKIKRILGNAENVILLTADVTLTATEMETINDNKVLFIGNIPAGKYPFFREFKMSVGDGDEDYDEGLSLSLLDDNDEYYMGETLGNYVVDSELVYHVAGGVNFNNSLADLHRENLYIKGSANATQGNRTVRIQAKYELKDIATFYN